MTDMSSVSGNQSDGISLEYISNSSISVSGNLSDSGDDIEIFLENEINILDQSPDDNNINSSNNTSTGGSGVSSPRGSTTSSVSQYKSKLSFGKKSIGYIGGLCLLIGNMTGPGMVSIPLQYQQGGWLLTTVAFVFICILSNISGLLMVEAISSIPYNSEFNLRIEYCMLAKFYFGKYGYYATQMFINCSLQATNIASIIVGSQVMDSMLIYIFKKTCGFEMYPHFGWVCVSSTSDHMSPFLDSFMLFTLGYFIVLFLIIPLGFFNLDDNIFVQIGAFIIMITVCSSWVVLFLTTGLHTSNSPTFGGTKGIAKILGNVVFNYAYITTLPSWVNESKSNVSIKKTIWISSGFSTFLFVAVGLLGSFAFGNMSSSSDILSVINSSPQANIFTKISVYAFPFAVLAASIPVFSIIVKYNLLQTKLPKFAVIGLSIFLPWIVVIPFMTGERLVYISNYASLFFSSASNFIIPLIIYLKSVQFRKNGRIMTDHQKSLLEGAGVNPILLEQSIAPTSSIDLEEQQMIYRVFPSLDIEKCKSIAIGCITILGIVIPLVIATTFLFESS